MPRSGDPTRSIRSAGVATPRGRPRGGWSERGGPPLVRRGDPPTERGCARVVRSRGTLAQGRTERGGPRGLRSDDRALAEVAEAARRTARVIAVLGPLGRDGAGGLAHPRPRFAERDRAVREGDRSPADEPAGGGPRSPGRLPRGGAQVVRRTRGETADPPRVGTVVGLGRSVRRHPGHSTPPSTGPEGQGPGPPRPRPGRGSIRGVRPPPGRGAGRPRRAWRPAGLPSVREEPQGPPPGMRPTRPEGSIRPRELDGEGDGPRGPRPAGRGPRRVRHGPTTRSAESGGIGAEGRAPRRARSECGGDPGVRRRVRSGPR